VLEGKQIGTLNMRSNDDMVRASLTCLMGGMDVVIVTVSTGVAALLSIGLQKLEPIVNSIDGEGSTFADGARGDLPPGDSTDVDSAATAIPAEIAVA